jgi:hypothetical protein
MVNDVSWCMDVQVAYNPKVLLPFSHLGETDEMRVQDASCLAARDERVSFWELQVECSAVAVKPAGTAHCCVDHLPAWSCQVAPSCAHTSTVHSTEAHACFITPRFQSA